MEIEESTKQRSARALLAVRVVERNEGDFGGDEAETPEGALLVDSARLGVWVFLATVTMLFAGFTSAYLVRKAGSDWQPIPLPSILWFNTTLLLLSSVTMEIGRARRHLWREDRLQGWLLATTLLGVAFLVGQFFAWRQLAAQGVYLPSNPHSSFFYILTGVHGLHLVGGVGTLIYLLAEFGRAGAASAQDNHLKLCAIYWHFVDGLWLFLFLVLFVL